MTLLSIVSIGCSDNNVEWESDEIPSDKITLDVQGILDLLHNETAIVKILTVPFQPVNRISILLST